MPGAALAAPGDVDTGFGTGGKYLQNFRVVGAVASTDAANDVVVQPDGRIVVVGSTYVFDPPTLSNDEFVVLRLSATGAPDALSGPADATLSFGAPPHNGANGIAVQSDGKLLLAGTDGSMGSNVNIDRLTSTGAFDGGFGGSGHPVIDFSGVDGAGVGTDGASDLALQPGGGVVAAGYSDNQFAIAALGPGGFYDTGFDANGRKRVDFSGSIDFARGVALSGSKIVAAGYTTGATDNKLALLSLNANGTPDTAFGVGTGRSEGGAAELPRGAEALAIQPDGKILVAGPGAGNFGVARIKTDGFYDPTFGVGGQVAVDFGTPNDVAHAIIQQPNGKILVAGTDGDGFAVARLNPDGSLDSTFGFGGKTTVNFGGADVARGMALQPDGKIVLAGTNGTDFAVTRLLGDPPPVVPTKKKCKKHRKLKRGKCVKKKRKKKR